MHQSLIWKAHLTPVGTHNIMAILYDANQISIFIEKLSRIIYDDIGNAKSIALLGIRSGGEFIGKRIQKKLLEKGIPEVDFGIIDNTIYRDDLHLAGDRQPRIRSTEIDFSLDDRTVVMIDDVLYSGRSIRAAIDAMMDFGRPSIVKLAVLFDRGGRELPIAADYIYEKVDVPVDKKITVYIKEKDGIEKVEIE